MKKKEDCNCTSVTKKGIVISCSGAADLGLISDKIARKMSQNGVRNMSCLALFASCSQEMLEKLKKNNILVIDGCSEDCAKIIMKDKGVKDYKYLRLTDWDYVKGQTPANESNVREIYEKAIMY